MSLLTLAAVVRYRAMIPLMYLVLTIEQVVRRMFTLFDRLPTMLTPSGPSIGSLINLAFVALLLTGLALSLGRRERVQGRDHARLGVDHEAGH